jgi:hypothetical protein
MKPVSNEDLWHTNKVAIVASPQNVAKWAKMAKNGTIGEK